MFKRLVRSIMSLAPRDDMDFYILSFEILAVVFSVASIALSLIGMLVFLQTI